MGTGVSKNSTDASDVGEVVESPQFVIGQKVRIIRNETWKGYVCTITRRSKHDPNMYRTKEHGWRRCDEIEAI